MENKIEQFLLQLPGNKRQIALQLRDIILASGPDIEEAIKWNQLTFFHGKKNILFIYTFTGVEYINLGFFEATSLTDPKKLFEGTGKRMRHIKIKTPEDIPAMQIKKWIGETIALQPKVA